MAKDVDLPLGNQLGACWWVIITDLYRWKHCTGIESAQESFQNWKDKSYEKISANDKG
jgi:hypothetical protein